MAANSTGPLAACRTLVLDAGPLLSLSPLRGLAETYVTVPQVLEELKDKRAREHFERLGLAAGVKVEIQEADAASLAQVIQFSKKTGDYSVLSHADLCVLALTYALDLKANAEKLQQVGEVEKNLTVTAEIVPADVPKVGDDVNPTPLANEVEEQGQAPLHDIYDESTEDTEDSQEEVEEDPEHDGVEFDSEPLDVILERVDDAPPSASLTDTPGSPSKALAAKLPPPLVEADSNAAVIYEDPSDSDDGEGEWITPGNVSVHKSRALDLLPSSNSSSDPFTVVSKKSKKRRNHGHAAGGADSGGGKEQIGAGCMTADFAMQNVLLQMGLSLVGVEGKRIEKVKSWVLRCHACFKICKDSTRKFCPTCGNPTLLRASVTASSPSATDATPTMQIHLKKNFTYRTRGTIYSIPAPQPGSSKKGSGEGLILREDQSGYMRAKKRDDVKREREDRKLVQGALQAGKTGGVSGLKVGSWMDPDWVPEILSVGIGGKGRSPADARTGSDGMPIIGHGRKNPNERRRRK